MDEPITDPLIGTEVAGYRITSLIGRGGMGVVYRGESSAGASVAIKVMAPEISGNQEFRDRFMRESESTIEHPNVVPVYETGSSGELLYIVMQLIEGSDLKTIIENEGRLLPARAGAIFVQAAAALDAAHENGIVHRDVKPQNILIESSNPSDRVFLTDFGLVKRASSQSSLTSSVFLMGSAYYMSPEHIEGKMIDGRADVYGLGCVLYESLTGSVPFDKENEVAVLWAHVNDVPPSVTSKVPVLSTGIDAIVAKALAKSPDDRYLTAGEFASAVASELGAPVARRATWAPSAIRASGARRVSAPRPRRGGHVVAPTRSRVPALAAAVITLVGLSSFGVASFRQGRPPQERAGLANTNEMPRSSDGSDPLGISAPAAKGSLHAHENHAPNRVTRGVADSLGRLSLEDEQGQLSTPLPLVSRGSPLAGTKIVFHHHYDDPGSGTAAQGGRGGELYMVEADGSNRIRLTTNGSEIRDGWPVWSPCGTIAYESNNPSSEFPDIWSLELAPGGNKTRRLTTAFMGENMPAWSPDCSKVAFKSSGSKFYVSPDATVETEPGDIYVVGSDGSDRTRITDWPEGETSPTWSPDGRRIAFASNHDGDWEIYVMRADGTNPRQITHNSVVDLDPVWSPDGRKIAFQRSAEYDVVTDRYARDEIWVMHPSGRRQKRLTQHASDVRPGSDNFKDGLPTWSPDGTRLLFYRVDGDQRAFYVMKADGSHQQIWLAGVDHAERPSWQAPHPRSVSFAPEGHLVRGSLVSQRQACTIGQPIRIERSTPDGWKTITRITSDAKGRFVASAGASGRYRIRVPFFINPTGDLCAPTYSPTF